MTITQTKTIATTATLLAGLSMYGCGGKAIGDQEVIGAGGSGHEAGVGGTGGTGGGTVFDGCPGLGCAPNCGDAGIAIDKNGCPTCTCNPGPDGGTGATGGTTGCGTSTCGSLEQCFKPQFCTANLVEVTGGYSLDATEVTRAQYAAWLGTSPTTGGQLPECSWNTGVDSFKPTGEWPPGTKGNHPVAFVDWCDAYAYCKAVGKRLCGKIGGGANGYSDYANASLSVWFNACSSGGTHNYPYGGNPGASDGFDGQKCNGSDLSVGTTVPVGTCLGCTSTESGYTGVYDLSGNVWEWEDSCDGFGGKQDYCRIRGGSFNSINVILRCGYGDNDIRAGNYDNVGFRCCSLWKL